jgi:hypothetical protein
MDRRSGGHGERGSGGERRVDGDELDQRGSLAGGERGRGQRQAPRGRDVHERTARQRLARSALHPGAHVLERRRAERLERARHLQSGGEAMVGVTDQPARDHGVDARRQPLGQRRWRREATLHDGHHGSAGVVGVDQALAGEHFPQHRGGGVDVAAPIDGAPGDLLRRHVTELALELAFARGGGAPRGLGDAEVEDARDAVDTDEQVLRGHVAVHDAQRHALVAGLVCRVQPGERAAQHRQRHRCGHALAALARQTRERGQRLALHILHHDEQLALARHHVQRGHHVGVPDARREPRLVQEHGHELRVGSELRVHALDGDAPGEAGRPHQLAFVDGGHAPRGDGMQELVTTELHDGRGHRGGDGIAAPGPRPSMAQRPQPAVCL